MKKTTFRVIILLSLVSVISAITFNIVYDHEYPELIKQYLDASDQSLSQLEWISFAATIVAFVANISLLFFSNIGRLIYVLCLPFTMILPSLNTNTVISNELQSLLFSLDSIMTGLVIGLCYFSSASTYFRDDASQNPKNIDP